MRVTLASSRGRPSGVWAVPPRVAAGVSSVSRRAGLGRGGARARRGRGGGRLGVGGGGRGGDGGGHGHRGGAGRADAQRVVAGQQVTEPVAAVRPGGGGGRHVTVLVGGHHQRGGEGLAV